MKRALSVLGIILGVMVVLFLAGCEEAGAGGGAEPTPTPTPLPGISWDFEDGTTQGWQGNGGATVEASTEQAAGGTTYSLKITTGDAGWKTAWYYDIENYIQADQTYLYKVWVYQETGSEQQFNLTLKSSDGTNEYYNSVFYQQTVPSGEWTLLEADFTLESATKGQPTDLYIESVTPSITFYVDEIDISPVTQ